MPDLFVVPHTHWDREWYEPAVRFRQRLVDAVDRALGLLESDRVPVFLLDGQAVLIRDYLDVRPEQQDRVERLAAAEKLLLGPWFVLADELLSSDETLVRNLLAGKREAGKGWLPLGYSPDAFGHPAALPTILRGFGIAHAIVWRGYGGKKGEGQDLFRWIGRDGSRVLVHHLPAAGYELGASLPTDIPEAARRWERLRAALEPRAQGRPLLLLSGADHHALQEELPGAIEALRTVSPPRSPSLATPLEYFSALTVKSPIHEVNGELRFSYGHCWTLQGTHAVRARLKALIREGERLMLRWAEPQAALAQTAGGPCRQPVIDAAWREHLLNTFHDTLCGTTTDEVARAAATRAQNVIAQARGICDDALHDRLAQDRSRARRTEARWTPTLAVVNPSAYDRSGVLEATLLVATDRVRIGAPAAPGTERVAFRQPSTSHRQPPRILDAAGRPLPVQILAGYAACDRLDAPDAYPLQDRVRAWRVAIWTDDVPALGVRTYRVDGSDGHDGSDGNDRRDGERWNAGRVVARGGVLRTRAWSVRAGAQGFRLDARTSGVSLDGVADVVSERDDGDLYTFEPALAESPVFARWHEPEIVWRGPLIGAIGRRFAIEGRARGIVYVRLDAGSGLVRVIADGENLTGGHRLRIRFPLPPSRPERSPAVRGAHHADQHYGPVSREREEYDLCDFPEEWPVQTAPMQRYVTVPGVFTVMGRDHYEYELTAEDAIAVTLLRSVSELSKGDLAARPGHAAWPAATPDAREIGSFHAEFGLTLETLVSGAPAGGWGRVERAAEEFHAPLAGRMLRYAIEAPAVVEGPKLDGEGLAFKACKLRGAEGAERVGEALVLRCVNMESRPASGTWELPFEVRHAWKARLDETPIEELEVTGGGTRVAFGVEPGEVVTVLVA